MSEELNSIYDSLNALPVAGTPERLGEAAYALSPENPVAALVELQKLSPEVAKEQVYQEIKKRRQAETKSALQQDFSPENLQAYLDSGNAPKEREFPEVVISSRAYENAAVASVKTGDSGRSYSYAQNSLVNADIAAVSANWDSITQKYAAEFDHTTGTAISGIAQQMVIPSTPIVGHVVTQLLGERYVSNYGSMLQALADSVTGIADEAGRTRQLERIAEAFSSVPRNFFPPIHKLKVGYDPATKETSVGLEKSYNDFVTHQLFTDLAPYLSGEAGTGTRYLHNFVGALDVASFIPFRVAGWAGGAVIRGLVNTFRSAKQAKGMGRTAPQEFISHLDVIDPETAARINAAAVVNERVAREVGTTPVQVLADTVPQAMPSDIEHLLSGAPTGIVKELGKISGELKEAFNVTPNTQLYSPETFRAVEDNLTSALKDVNKEITPHLDKSAFARSFDVNEVEFRHVWGRDSQGFASPEEAISAWQATLKDVKAANLEIESVRVLHLDKVSKELREVGEEVLPSGTEYFIQLSGKKKVVPSDVEGISLEGVREIPRSVSWFSGPHHTFSGWMDNAFTVAARMRDQAKHDIDRAFSPYLKLGNKDKRVVSDALETTRKTETEFTWGQLKHDLNYTDEQALAYLSTRDGYVKLYRAKDKDLRDGMVGEGYKRIIVPKEGAPTMEFAVVPKKTAEDTAGITKVYDPVLARDIKMDPALRTTLLEDGYYFGTLYRNIYSGEIAYKHILIRPTDRLTELPENVLKKRPGWSPSILSDPFYVVLSRGGEAKVVGTSISRKYASEYADKVRKSLEADGKTGYTVDTRLGREYDLEGQRAGKPTLDQTLDFWFEPRSEPIRRITGEGLSKELSPALDPLEGTQRVLAQFANHVGLDDLIESMGSAVRKEYPGFFRDGVYIRDTSSPVGKKVDMLMKRVRVYERLPTTGEVLVQTLFHDVDSLVSRIPGRAGNLLSEVSGKVFVQGIGTINPARKLANVASSLIIRADPFKQAVMNTATILQISAIDPVIALKTIPQGVLLFRAAALSRGGKDIEGVAALARKVGMEPAKFKKMVDAFLKQGNLAGVDNNVFLAEIGTATDAYLAKTIAGQTYQTGTLPLRTLFRLSQKYGIDLGETLYQSMLLPFSIARFEKANPGIDPFKNLHTIQGIIADTKKIGFDMTSLSGRFGYQGGVLAPITQYLAFSHMAALNLFNKNLSKAEKTRYIIGSAVLGGATGLGITNTMWENAKAEAGIGDINPHIDNLAKGGTFDLVGNAILGWAFGDYKVPKTNIAGLLAPGSRMWTFLEGPYEAIFEPGNKSFAEKILGAAGGQTSKLYGFARGMYTMWGHAPANWGETSESLLRTVEEMAGLVRVLDGPIQLIYARGIANDITNGVNPKLSKDFSRYSGVETNSEQFMRLILGASSSISSVEDVLRMDITDKERLAKKTAKDVWGIVGRKMLSEGPTENNVKYIGNLLKSLESGDPLLHALVMQELVHIQATAPKDKMKELVGKAVEYYGVGPQYLPKLKHALAADDSLSEEDRTRIYNGIEKMHIDILKAIPGEL